RQRYPIDRVRNSSSHQQGESQPNPFEKTPPGNLPRLRGNAVKPLEHGTKTASKIQHNSGEKIFSQKQRETAG
ncbi:hypothetical protein ABC974_22735, partial [Sphingomonas oligophenolica]